MKQNLKVRLASLLLLAFLPTCAVNAFANPQKVDPVQSIRKQYTDINKRIGSYRKVKKELSGFWLEGGQLVAYFDGPAIVKIVANHYSEAGRAFEEYYYSNQKLIFVFHKEYGYDRPLSGKVVQTFESRFYFENDRLIRWLSAVGRPADDDIEAFNQKRDQYLEWSRKFVEGARSRDPIIEA